jgi:hypothetical protein
MTHTQHAPHLDAYRKSTIHKEIERDKELNTENKVSLEIGRVRIKTL